MSLLDDVARRLATIEVESAGGRTAPPAEAGRGRKAPRQVSLAVAGVQVLLRQRRPGGLVHDVLSKRTEKVLGSVERFQSDPDYWKAYSKSGRLIERTHYRDEAVEVVVRHRAKQIKKAREARRSGEALPDEPVQ